MFVVECNAVFIVECNALFVVECNAVFVVECNAVFVVECNTEFVVECNTVFDKTSVVQFLQHYVLHKFGFLTDVNRLSGAAIDFEDAL